MKIGHVSSVEETVDSYDAYNYYSKAYDFTMWYNKIIGSLNLGKNSYDVSYSSILKIAEKNQAIPGQVSEFNKEKYKVIRDAIEENLIQAMDNYKKKSNIDFAMPIFTENDWIDIYNNMCVLTFVQGLPVGTTIYNNYFIIPNTTNNQYINDETIYYIGDDDFYHRIGCEHLTGDTITGYNKTEFLRQTGIDSNGKVYKNSENKEVYYYLHKEKACYYCIVKASNSKVGKLDVSNENKLIAYYKALAREKNRAVRLSDYMSQSGVQKNKVDTLLDKQGGEIGIGDDYVKSRIRRY